ncbi:hypothetical protein FXO37_00638 [Capsicum annuum]|nr:hypothetical protein FXO37_00638 [Capsicum annuum]
MSSSSLSLNAPKIFTGENYQIWSVKMKSYLQAYDLWEVVADDTPLQPLPENPTVAQIKSHSDEKLKKFKAKTVIQNSVADSIFSKIIACEAANEAWEKLKKEYQGSNQVRQMQILNLKRNFESLRMQEDETTAKYSEKISLLVSKISSGKEARVDKIKIKYNFLPKYCKRCKLQGHKEDECRSLHPELKKKVTENIVDHDKENKGHNKVLSRDLVRFEDVGSNLKWQPTIRRSRNTKESKSDQSLNTKNAFETLADEDENDKEEEEHTVMMVAESDIVSRPLADKSIKENIISHSMKEGNKDVDRANRAITDAVMIKVNGDEIRPINSIENFSAGDDFKIPTSTATTLQLVNKHQEDGSKSSEKTEATRLFSVEAKLQQSHSDAKEPNAKNQLLIINSESQIIQDNGLDFEEDLDEARALENASYMEPLEVDISATFDSAAIERFHTAKEDHMLALSDPPDNSIVKVVEVLTDSPNKTLHDILTHKVDTLAIEAGEGGKIDLKEDQIFEDADLSPRVIKAIKSARKGKKQGNGKDSQPVRVQPKRNVVSLFAKCK